MTVGVEGSQGRISRPRLSSKTSRGRSTKARIQDLPVEPGQEREEMLQEEMLDGEAAILSSNQLNQLLSISWRKVPDL